MGASAESGGPHGKERRQHTRQLYKGAQILCYSADHPKTGNPYNFATHLVDVSRGGICILSVGKLRAGVRLIVDVHFQQHSGRLYSPATVRWSSEVEYRGKTLHMTGLQFTGRPELTGGAWNAIRGKDIPRRDPVRDTAKRRAERRRSSRARVHLSEVVCRPPGLFSAFGLRRNMARILVDISRTGAQISSTRRMQPGRRVRLRVQIPKFGDVLSVGAVVRWCVPDKFSEREKRYFLGLSFDEIPVKSQSVLDGLHRWFQSKEKNA